MYIVVSDLPVHVFDLFEGISNLKKEISMAFKNNDDEAYNKLATKFGTSLMQFKSYLKENILKRIEPHYIDEQLLEDELFEALFFKFASEKEKVETDKFKQLMRCEDIRNEFYAKVFDEIIKKEIEKNNELTREELSEIEQNCRKNVISPHQQEILEKRIYCSFKDGIKFNENPMMDKIEVYHNLFHRDLQCLISFEHNGQIYSVKENHLEGEELEWLDEHEKSLKSLPATYESNNSRLKNKTRKCPILKKGEYIDDFNVDISGINLKSINVKEIKNINYILLFLRAYEENMADDFLYRRNFEVLKRNIKPDPSGFRGNLQILKKLNKKEELDTSLTLFKEVIEYYLKAELIQRKIELMAEYLEDLLEQWQEIDNLKLHKRTTLVFYSLAKERFIEDAKSMDLITECSKILKDDVDQELWDFLVQLVEENQELLLICSWNGIGKSNYLRWKNFEVDNIRLATVKTIGSYGITKENEIIKNVHGVEIKLDDWEFYKWMSARLAFGGIFRDDLINPFTMEQQEAAYRNLFGPHEFYIIRSKVDQSLHLEAKKVLNHNQTDYMVHAFLTKEEFNETCRILKIIYGHVCFMDLNSSKVEDYYIDWESEKIKQWKLD